VATPKNHMRSLSVYYCGWGEDWLLGRLAEDGRNVVFEYSPQALAHGVELSPLHLKLRAQGYGNFPQYLHGLPGLVYDSLPDGWGLLLMDRLFRQRRFAPPSPLERLAFVGNRALGALRFVPAHAAGMDTEAPDWSLLELAGLSQSILEDEANGQGSAEDVLRGLALTGGSPQGARPKALVQYDAANNQASTRTDTIANGQPWLVKFPARGEHGEVCAIEQLYMELARACGLDVTASRWFESGTLTAFGIERFDRRIVHNSDQTKTVWRIPMHSLAGLLHVDFRMPGSTDYTALLRATQLLTRDVREVEKAYARAVFNVIFHNRDDHPKNFAWCLGQDQRWRLSPVFDVTFSDGPGGQHSMDVCGEGATIERRHLLQLATETGVAPKAAETIMTRVQEQASRFTQHAANFPIRRSMLKDMRQQIEQCSKRLLNPARSRSGSRC